MKYENILHMPRPKSKYPKMSVEDRAAQFAPFAALTGYDDQVKESARIVDEKLTLDEESLILLDRSFKELVKVISKRPEVYITYFINDEKKYGGMYVDEKKTVLKIDMEKRILSFTDEKNVEFDDIYSLEVLK